MRYFILALSLVLLGGCTHTITRTDGPMAERKLARSASFYLMVPADGQYRQTIYRGSGRTTAQVIKGSIGRFTNKVDQGTGVESLEKALETAKEAGAAYVVQPIILHWEDRATQWSGIPDRIRVSISVIDAQTGETVRSTVINGKSKWATFGGDHPQDLLPEPVDSFVEELF